MKPLFLLILVVAVTITSTHVGSLSTEGHARRRLDSLRFDSMESKVEQGFLLPVVRGGPNNEIVGMKEVLALGRLLGRIVVLTGIIESPQETREQRAPEALPRVIPFDSIFDADAIQSAQPVTFLPDLYERGWDGAVDQLVLFNGKGNPLVYIKRWEEAFNITLQETPRHEEADFKCLPEHIVNLKKRLEEPALEELPSSHRRR